MPRERAPIHPLPIGHQPPNSVAYRVADGETWESIGRQCGLSAAGLMRFNFGTADIAEVNWYLRRYVGCRTADETDTIWLFRDSDAPGVIHVPLGRPRLVPETERSEADGSASEGLWLGLLDAEAARARRAPGEIGTMIRYDKPAVEHRVEVRGWRLDAPRARPPAGVLLLATSVSDPAELDGYAIGWIDVQATLGARWFAIARAMQHLENGLRVLRSLTRAQRSSARATEWRRVRDLARHIATTLGMEPDAPAPQVRAIAIPGQGFGAEASLAWRIGTLALRPSLAEAEPAKQAM
ncbi:MAG TPA: hypothetical protein VMM18_03055 [Gemmatimonadaceae bacterium]|nr:hypothetical protein [Gemmatimonadaceae bacterium]